MSAANVLDRDVLAPAPALRRARQSYKAPGLAALGFVALLGVAEYGYNWWINGRFIETTNDAYVGGDVTQIAPHVAGFVSEILVADNEYVHAGQTLVRLKPDDFQAALRHAQAALEARQAALDNLEARRVLQHSIIAAAQAEVAEKQAQAVFAAKDSERYSSLALTAAGSRQNAEKALAGEQSAHAAVLASAAALDAANQ
jgi:membrane fusion protein (multidrug efflux system)